jgi:hypothetical protein
MHQRTGCCHVLEVALKLWLALNAAAAAAAAAAFVAATAAYYDLK